MRNAGHVVTRTMLLENVWDYHFDPQTNVIDVHVSRLRQKIDKNFERPLLHTVRGAGYCLRAAGIAQRTRRDGRSRSSPTARAAARDRGHGPAGFAGISLRAARAHPCVSAGGALFRWCSRPSVLGVLFFVYWTSADFVERQTEATLDAEITGLAEQYAQRGLSGLVQIVAARSAGDRGDAHALSRHRPRRAGRSPATSPAGRPACRAAPAGCRSRSRCNGKGRIETAPGARPAVHHPRRLSPAGRPRHQRRGGLPRPGQDDAAVVGAGGARRRPRRRHRR